MSIIGSNILAGASGQGGGYTIENSLRFQASATAYLSRTNTNSPTNNKIGTLSMWVKRGALSSGTGNNQYLIETGTGSTNNSYFQLYFVTTDNLSMGQYSWAGYTTTQVYRDPSAWYHIVLSYNSTLASNNVSLYVNNVLQGTTTVTQNTNWAILNSGQEIDIGRHSGVNRPFDGYITEVNLIDGQALDPTSFGEYNADTGVWQPVKYAGTYGTNGFYLNFSDASTTTTLGYDYSGQSNNWLLNNFSLTGTDYCSMTDTPTPYLGGGNYAVLNPLDTHSSTTLSDGNLKQTGLGLGRSNASLRLPSSGKWYCEFINSSATNSNIGIGFGVSADSVPLNGNSAATNSYHFYASNAGYITNSGTYTAISSWTNSANQTFQLAVDIDNGKVWIGQNNIWWNSSGGSTGDPSTGANPTFTLSATGFKVFTYIDSITSFSWQANFGQRPFAYTPPTGFLPLHTGNLPDSDIVDGSKYFDVLTYTGNGYPTSGTQSVTGLDFQPDFLWIKDRSAALNNFLQDSIRGSTKVLRSNTTGAENTEATAVTSFDANGFSLGANNEVNTQNDAFVGWSWKANGTGVSNGAGSIESTVSANQAAGFSIVSFTTNNTAGATVGHSLGAVPAVIIVKYRNLTGTNWVVYHKNMSATPQNNYLNLNLPNGIGTSSDPWNNTAPTSSVITLGSGVGSASSTNYGTYDSVAYCFAEVEGFSKFDKYLGNGLPDGPFVYCGFRPKFVLIKSTAGDNWTIVDTSRNPYNVANARLFPSAPNQEATATDNCDILSNGFKVRIGSTDTGANGNGTTYIYMAFAENPFKNSLAR